MFSFSLQLALSRLWFILSRHRLLACTAVFPPVSSSARPTACSLQAVGDFLKELQNRCMSHSV